LSKGSGIRAEKPKFIVVGRTRDLRSSKPILQRCKSEEELRDVFAVSRLSKAARELYVFRVVEQPDEDTWFLISFDIKYVYGKKTQRKRPATYEYTVIKESMYSGACGRIDSSTYICPEDASDVPLNSVDTDPEAVKVESWMVKPMDDKTRLWMKSAVLEAINYYKTVTTALIVNAEQKMRGQGVRKARELLDTLRLMLSAPWRPKVERLVGSEVFAELSAVTKMLENALQRLEERKAAGGFRAKQQRGSQRCT